MVSKGGRIEMQNLLHDKTSNQQTNIIYIIKKLHFAKYLKDVLTSLKTMVCDGRTSTEKCGGGGSHSKTGTALKMKKLDF
jgi:hypothetical protein